MCETLYAEVDLIETVVGLVKQDHYSGVSVAIFGPTQRRRAPPVLPVALPVAPERFWQA